jgi:hypothetical protein
MSLGGQNASARSGQAGRGRSSGHRGSGNNGGSYVQEGPRVLGTGRAVATNRIVEKQQPEGLSIAALLRPQIRAYMLQIGLSPTAAHLELEILP